MKVYLLQLYKIQKYTKAPTGVSADGALYLVLFLQRTLQCPKVLRAFKVKRARRSQELCTLRGL